MINNNMIDLPDFKDYDDTNAIIVFRHQGELYILGCTTIGRPNVRNSISMLPNDKLISCECNMNYTSTQIPLTFQKKFMEDIDKQIVKDYDDKREELERKISEYQAETEACYKRMKSKYKMLEEFMKFAEHVTNVDKNLFDTWLDMKHLMEEKGIQFSDN